MPLNCYVVETICDFSDNNKRVFVFPPGKSLLELFWSAVDWVRGHGADIEEWLCISLAEV